MSIFMNEVMDKIDNQSILRDEDGQWMMPVWQNFCLTTFSLIRIASGTQQLQMFFMRSQSCCSLEMNQNYRVKKQIKMETKQETIVRTTPMLEKLVMCCFSSSNQAYIMSFCQVAHKYPFKWSLLHYFLPSLFYNPLWLLSQSCSIYYYNQRRMTDQIDPQPISPPPLAQLATRWFHSHKKTRKEVDWTPLYAQITAFLLSDVDISQLLVSAPVLHESAQLLLNSLVCLQKQKDEIFAQCLGVEMLILLTGTLLIDERLPEVAGITNLVSPSASRIEKTQFRPKQKCIILKGQRKVFQKFRNDILRLDREEKESFISRHLFCGLTPVYPLTAVKLVLLSEPTELKSQEGAIVLLHQGLIRRKPKKNGEGTQLTSGSIVNSRQLAKIIQMSHSDREGEELLETLEETLLIKFQSDQFLRILKLNPNLKKILQHKLRVIFNERQELQTKSIEVEDNFTNRSRLDCSAVRKHYAIQFRSRPKTAVTGRSFRRKHDNDSTDQNIGDFITFDRYDKMLASKERVVVAKAGFQLEARGKAIITFDYDKKLKMQNKMIKIQTGKIKRLGQRESVTENAHIKKIKKKLFQVTHLFDQPLDPSSLGTPRTKDIVERKPATNRRTSGIKPEEYLKEEYLNAFLSQSSSELKVKERLNEAKMMSQLVLDKENNITVSRFSKNESCLGMKKKSALKLTMNSTIS